MFAAELRAGTAGAKSLAGFVVASRAMAEAHEPEVTRVPRAAQRRMRWKNGLGWTTELAVRPAAGEFDWRISIAEVDADSDFSRFAGVDRSICVLAGLGFDLHVEDEAPALLRAGDPPHAFAGDRPARCVIVGGSSSDFNVMTRRGRVTHAATREGPTERRGLACAPGVGWVVYASRGEVTVGGVAAEEGDCVIVEPDPRDRSEVALAIAGEALLVRLELLA